MTLPHNSRTGARVRTYKHIHHEAMICLDQFQNPLKWVCFRIRNWKLLLPQLIGSCMGEMVALYRGNAAVIKLVGPKNPDAPLNRRRIQIVGVRNEWGSEIPHRLAHACHTDRS